MFYTILVAILAFACGYLIRGDDVSKEAIAKCGDAANRKANITLERVQGLFKPRKAQIRVLSKSEPKTAEKANFERVEALFK